MGGQCQKNCLLMVQFNKDFIEIYNEDNDEKYFLEVDVQYPEKFSQFPWKNENWKSWKTCSQVARKKNKKR